MKTSQLKSFAIAAIILLAAAWGRAETARSSDPRLNGEGTISPAAECRITEIHGADAPAAAPAAYLWKRFFADDQSKAALAGIAADAAGNVYATKGCGIVRITSEGKMTAFAGAAQTPGSADGLGPAARFNAPNALAFDASGSLYVSDQKNHTIRKVTPAAVVTTLAGSAGSEGTADGTGGGARFYHPGGIGVDGLGNLFVGDVCNNTIRRITTAGVVATLAGRSGAGQFRLNNSDAAVGMPAGFAVDAGGNVYYVRHLDHVIRKVTQDGMITTVGGMDDEAPEMVDGPRGVARFQKPAGLAIDGQGNLYVADLGSIRRLSPDGTVSTIGGKSGTPGGVDASPGIALFDKPLGVAVTSAGIIYATCSDGILQGTPVR